MRTTLDIEPDVLAAAKIIASRTRRTAGKVLSDLARQSLTGTFSPPNSERHVRNGFETMPSDGRVITSAFVSQLEEEADLG